MKKSLISVTLISQTLNYIGIFIHLWTTWIAYNHDGIWWALLHFCLYIYAEFYWAYKLWVGGESLVYPVIAGLWAVLYSVSICLSIIFRKKLKAATDEI